MSTTIQWVIRCDWRPCTSTLLRARTDRAGARQSAVDDAGWLVVGGQDWCPEHVDKGRAARLSRDNYERVLRNAGLRA